MSKNLELSLSLIAKDQASRPLAQAMRNVAKESKAAERAVVGISRESQRMASARERLGVRSERAIQREIQLTEAAYKRLTASGSLSVREQSRAYQAMRSQVSGLRKEMEGMGQSQSKLIAGAKGIAAAGAGLYAAGRVLSAPINRTMDYNRRLAMMANTAYDDEGVEGRKQGIGKLDNAVKTAVRAGGGNKEQAAETLDNLIASGAMPIQSAMNILPTLQKYATATGADPNELGNIAIRSMQTFGITEQQIPMALDMAIKAGQKGGFEIKDMAKWLPQQMAAAKNAGLSGMSGLAKLLAVNQSAVITAGSKDEAGNNLVNLLAKINSSDTAKDAAKISAKTFGKKKKGDKGVDLSGTLAAARGKGMDSLDAFVGLVDKVVANDKRYQNIQAQLATAKDSERKSLLESQADILQGSAIGQLIQDRQALMALVGYMGNRDYVKSIEKDLPNAAGTGQTNYELIQSTASHQIERAANEKSFAEQEAFNGLSATVGDVAGKLADYAQVYPGLTAALVGGGTAVTALAAAAAAAAIPLALIGKGGLGGLGGGKGGPLASSGGKGMPGGGKLAGLGQVGLLSSIGFMFVPDVDEQKGRKAAKDGDLWEASKYLPAGEFLGVLWDKMTPRLDPAPYKRGLPSDTAPIGQLPATGAPFMPQGTATQLPFQQMLAAQQAQNTAFASQLTQAANTFQQAANKPVQVQVSGQFRVQSGDLVATVNQANTQTARRN